MYLLSFMVTHIGTIDAYKYVPRSLYTKHHKYIMERKEKYQNVCYKCSVMYASYLLGRVGSGIGQWMCCEVICLQLRNEKLSLICRGLSAVASECFLSSVFTFRDRLVPYLIYTFDVLIYDHVNNSHHRFS